MLQSLIGTAVREGMGTVHSWATSTATGPEASGALSSPLLPALSLFLFTHRRMAITGDDVSLDQIVPVSRDFTLEEGATVGWAV